MRSIKRDRSEISAKQRVVAHASVRLGELQFTDSVDAQTAG